MSVGTAVTAIVLIGIFSFLYIAMGVGVDKIYTKNNDMIAADTPYSQGRLDALTGMFNVWYALPVAVLLLILFWAIKQALADKDTVV